MNRYVSLLGICIAITACESKASPIDADRDTSRDGGVDAQGDAQPDAGGADTGGSDATSALGDSATEGCDAGSFEPYCVEDDIFYCEDSLVKSRDCGDDGVNPFCRVVGTSAGCRAADDPTQSCEELPRCREIGGAHYSLSCTMLTEEWDVRYGLCPSGCNESGCTAGPPCTGTESSCSGTILTRCSSDTLQRFDCTDFGGRICATSTVDSTSHGCVEPEQAPCDPDTFVDHCTGPLTGIFCLPALGFTQPTSCGADESCCEGQCCAVE